MARILVVDDEADMRLALSNVLTRTGHQVSEAPEGETALAAVAKENIELMLLDMRLPGMDGIQILKQVRQTKPDLPVIMVTGYGSVDSAIEVMRLGASHYLAKPFSNKELIESVERILKSKRLPVPAGAAAQTLGAAAPEAPGSAEARAAGGEGAARALIPAQPDSPPGDSPASALPKLPELPSRDAVWGLALAAALALLAWPLVSRWRERGRAFEIGYSHPTAVAWVGDRLWTADWMSQTVYEQELEGRALKVVRAMPLPQTHLTGLAVTEDAVYVADGWRHEIQRRRPDARLSLERAIKSPGPNPSGLYFDGRHLWSADATLGRFYQHELDDDLTVIASYKSPESSPVAVYKDDRYFWSADGESRLIYRHRLDSKLQVLATYRRPELNEGPQRLSCFTQRGRSLWIGRDGLSRLLEVPAGGFEVRHREP